jgi:3-oxoacyl-(acyl-carrier-protein) synthase
MKKLAKKCFSETKRRVVVTGMGMVSPLGINLEENWENMKQGRSGIRDLSKEAYGKDLPSNCKLGGTIPYNFDGKKFRTLVII